MLKSVILCRWKSLHKQFEKLQTNYEAEYKQYGLDAAVIGLITPVVSNKDYGHVQCFVWFLTQNPHLIVQKDQCWLESVRRSDA